MTRVFVTGGAGFIGSNFVQHLLSFGKDSHVINYDNLTYAGNLANLEAVASLPNYEFVRGDICDAARVRDSMRGCDAVVHFAAESHVDRSIYELGPFIDTNIRGTCVLMHVARALGIKRFIHVSTDEVYGDLDLAEIAREDSPLRPSSPYAASKASADLLVLAFKRTYGFPAIITRGSNTYGPYQFPEKFIPLMICNAIEDKPLPIYGDGQQQREWLHVHDHCRAVRLVLERGRDDEIYNVGSGEAEKNLTMAHSILDILGKPRALIQHVTDRPGHDGRYAMDSSKIREELGWEPSIPLDEGISKTVEWYRSNTAWLRAVRDRTYQEYYETFYTRRDSSFSALALESVKMQE